MGLVKYDLQKTSQASSNVLLYNPALISAPLCIAYRKYRGRSDTLRDMQVLISCHACLLFSSSIQLV
jgi:hypothetical protein